MNFYPEGEHLKILLQTSIFIACSMFSFSCKKLTESQVATDVPPPPGTSQDSKVGEVYVLLAEDQNFSKMVVSAPEGSEKVIMCRYQTIVDCKNEITALDPSALNDRSAIKIGKKEDRELFYFSESIDPLETRSIVLISGKYEVNDFVILGESLVNFEPRLAEN